MDGCSDGIFSGTGHKYFDSPPGHGLYYPLALLRPDERFGCMPASTGVSSHAHDNRMKYL